MEWVLWVVIAVGISPSGNIQFGLLHDDGHPSLALCEQAWGELMALTKGLPNPPIGHTCKLMGETPQMPEFKDT